MSERRVMRLQHRETGEMSGEFDMTGWSVHNFDRMWDGLVRKVDFSIWRPIYEPERGNNQTAADWLEPSAEADQ